MLNLKVLIEIIVISFLVTICVAQNIRPLDAIPADSVSRFPHNVVIRIQEANNVHVCSGSIITEQWILTSLKCVGMAKEFAVEFKRLHLNSTNFVFSVGLINPEVHRYPTEFDDIVLIKLPIKLVFDDELKSIVIANKSDAEIAKKFSTMPGFNGNNGNDRLATNMFQIAEPSECIKEFGNKFDEYLQICAKEWKHYTINACGTDLGAGLLINWPQNSQLVGVLSGPVNCSSTQQKLAVFTNVAKYMNWMEQIVENMQTSLFDVETIKIYNPTVTLSKDGKKKKY